MLRHRFRLPWSRHQPDESGPAQEPAIIPPPLRQPTRTASPKKPTRRIATGPKGGLAERIWDPGNLREAWRRVRANKGGPGVDRVSLQQFEQDLDRQLTEIQRALQDGSYRPQPFLRVLIPKSDGDLRPLAIPTIRDRVIQRATYHVVDPLCDPHFQECSYGFRQGRGVREATAAILHHRDEGYRWVVDADIQSCFDRLDHGLMLKFVRRHIQDRRVVRLIELWLDAGIFRELGGGMGVAQGSAISPLLANVYLDRFDVDMVRRNQILVRYADDFVVLCRTKREAHQAHQITAQVLQSLRLKLNPQKTRVTDFDHGFKFLGVFFLRNEHFWL